MISYKSDKIDQFIIGDNTQKFFIENPNFHPHKIPYNCFKMPDDEIIKTEIGYYSLEFEISDLENLIRELKAINCYKIRITNEENYHRDREFKIDWLRKPAQDQIDFYEKMDRENKEKQKIFYDLNEKYLQAKRKDEEIIAINTAYTEYKNAEGKFLAFKSRMKELGIIKD